jgi:hypothetical protein
MKTILIEPNEKYIKYIETSLHYMNDPKFMFNDSLHSVGRLQGFNAVVSFLKYYSYSKPNEVAKYVMENIVTVKYSEFIKININSYINKEIKDLNLVCQYTHNKFEKEFIKYRDEQDKRLCLGVYSGIYR